MSSSPAVVPEAPDPLLMAAKATAFQSMRADSRVWHEALDTAVEKVVALVRESADAVDPVRAELSTRIGDSGAWPVSAGEAVEAERRQDQADAVQIGSPDCQHESKTGDEGPVRDLPGGLSTVVRWRCDGCGAVSYDDTGLAALRAELGAAVRRADAAEAALDLLRKARQ